MSASLDWSTCSVLESVPGKLNGAWVFRGTRVPVSAVLENLKEMSISEIVGEYSSVTAEQVRTVLDFIAASADAALLAAAAANSGASSRSFLTRPERSYAFDVWPAGVLRVRCGGV